MRKLINELIEVMQVQVGYLVVAVDNISRPIVAAHYPHVTVLPCQFERIGNLVHVRLEERQSAAGGVPLRVVIVDEDKRVEGVHHAPTLAKGLQVRQLLAVILPHNIGKISSEAEFGNAADVRVFAGCNCTSAVVDNLEMIADRFLMLQRLSLHRA